ncbi:MAG: DUF3018 family protein [Chloroflexota bacterium]|nr:MAG: DUF3018 family protein [Chloroflexota bacterium]
MDSTVKSPRVRAREFRERQRARGLREIRFWVPDVRTEAFRAEARRQSLVVAMSEQEDEDQAFVDAVSVWNDE